MSVFEDCNDLLGPRTVKKEDINPKILRRVDPDPEKAKIYWWDTCRHCKFPVLMAKWTLYDSVNDTGTEASARLACYFCWNDGRIFQRTTLRDCSVRQLILRTPYYEPLDDSDDET